MAVQRTSSFGKSEYFSGLFQASALPADDMEEWHKNTCRQLAKASCALRNGDIPAALSVYAEVLSDFRIDDEVPHADQLSYYVEAKLGMAEIHFISQRSEKGINRLWHLLSALGIGQDMSDLLASYPETQNLSSVQLRLLQESVRSKRTAFESCLNSILNAQMAGKTQKTITSQRHASFYHKFNLNSDRFGNISTTPAKSEARIFQSNQSPVTKFVEDLQQSLLNCDGSCFQKLFQSKEDSQRIPVNFHSKEEYLATLRRDVKNLSEDHGPLNSIVQTFVKENLQAVKDRVYGHSFSTIDWYRSVKKGENNLAIESLRLSGMLTEKNIMVEIEYDVDYLAHTLRTEKTRKIQTELNKRRQILRENHELLRTNNTHSNTFPLSRHTPRPELRIPRDDDEDFTNVTTNSPDACQDKRASKLLLKTEKSRLLSTLLRCLLDMAKSYMDQGILVTAEDLFQSSLNIAETLSNHFGKKYVRRFEIPKTYYYLGRIKCQLGNRMEGIKFIKNGIEVFQESHDNERFSLALAESWYMLGCAYLGNCTREASFFRCILSLLYKCLTGDSFQPHDFAKLFRENVDSEESVLVKEALDAFQTCKSAVESIRQDTEENINPPVHSQVLIKIGDCHLIQNDYDGALEYYEAALKLHSTETTGEGISDQVHILCMLGTVRICMENPYQSVVIFETARVLKRHHGTEKSEESAHRKQVDYNLLVLWAPMSVGYFKTDQYIKCISTSDYVVKHLLSAYEQDLKGASRSELWLVKQCYYMSAICHAHLKNYETSLQYLQNAKSVMGIDVHQKLLIWLALLFVYQNMLESSPKSESSDELLETYTEILGIESDLPDIISNAACDLLSELCCQGVRYFKVNNDTTMSNRFTKLSLKCQAKRKHTVKSDIVSLTLNLADNALECMEIERAMEIVENGLEACHEEANILQKQRAQLLAKLAEIYFSQFSTERKDILFESELLQYLGDKTRFYFRETLKHNYSITVALKFALFLIQTGQKQEAMDYALVASNTVTSDTQEDSCVLFMRYEFCALPSLLCVGTDLYTKQEFSTDIFTQFILVHINDSPKTIIDKLKHICECSTNMTSRNLDDLRLGAVALLLHGYFLEAALLFELSQEKTTKHTTGTEVLVTWSLSYATLLFSTQIQISIDIILTVMYYLQFLFKNTMK